jgi:HEAT repeat protein
MILQAAVPAAGGGAEPPVVETVCGSPTVTLRDGSQLLGGPLDIDALSTFSSAGKLRIPEEEDGSVAAALPAVPADEKLRTTMDWITLLRHADLETRRKAVKVLGSVGPNDKDRDTAIVALIDALKDLSTRYAATEALAEIGSAAVPPLIEKALEEDRKRGLRDPYALQALAAIGADAVPALIRALLLRAEERAREQERIRQSFHVPRPPIPVSTCVAMTACQATGEEAKPEFASTLALIGRPAVRPMVEILESSRNLEAVQAAAVLGLMGPEAEEAIPALVKTMHHQDAGVAAAAAQAIRWICPAGNPALVSEFKKALRDRDKGLRLTAAAVLIAWRRSDKEVVDTCLELLREANLPVGASAAEVDNSKWCARVAAELLGKVEPHSPRIVSALMDELDSSNHFAAAKSLGRIGPDAAAAIPLLIPRWMDEAARLGPSAVEPLARILDDESPADREKAAKALWSMGPAAKDAVPALLTALEGEKVAKVRRSILQALGSIGPQAEPAVPVLLEMVKSESEDRWVAVASLGKIGVPARPAIPALVPLLEDSFFWPYVAEAISRIDPSHPMLMPILLKKLSGDDRNEIARVAGVLGGIGPPAKEVLPALVAAKATTGGYASDAITMAIGRIDPSHPDGIPALIKNLKHPEEVFRKLAAYSLGDIGPPTKQAVPALTEALHDRAWCVRLGAARALKQMDPSAAKP